MITYLFIYCQKTTVNDLIFIVHQIPWAPVTLFLTVYSWHSYYCVVFVTIMLTSSCTWVSDNKKLMLWSEHLPECQHLFVNLCPNRTVEWLVKNILLFSQKWPSPLWQSVMMIGKLLFWLEFHPYKLEIFNIQLVDSFSPNHSWHCKGQFANHSCCIK